MLASQLFIEFIGTYVLCSIILSNPKPIPIGLAVSNPAEALQVALAHLLFNVIGIIIWFPHPRMRNIPLKGAEKLGEYCSINKAFPFIYTGTVFFAIPGIAYGITYAISN